VSKHVNSDIVIAELDSSSAGGQLADMEFTRGLVIIIKHGSVKIRDKNSTRQLSGAGIVRDSLWHRYYAICRYMYGEFVLNSSISY